MQNGYLNGHFVPAEWQDCRYPDKEFGRSQIRSDDEIDDNLVEDILVDGEC